MKTLKKTLHLLEIIFMIHILVLILLYLFSPFINNHTAADIARALQTLPLPENTEYLDSTSAAAKLVGNGNGMQYFGAILIKSELSLDELDEYYNNFRKSDWDIFIEEQTGSEVVFIEHRKIAFQAGMPPEGNCYIIYTWGDGMFPFSEFDLRGH